MKIGLYTHEEKEDYFIGQLFAELYCSKFEEINKNKLEIIVNKHCLCEIPKEDFQSLDIAFVHPHRDNRTECWNKIKEILVNNQNLQVYLMVMHADDTQYFFGDKQPNLMYIDRYTQREFFQDPIKYFKEHALIKKIVYNLGLPLPSQ